MTTDLDMLVAERAAQISERIANVTRRIAEAGGSDAVQLLAVSKGHDQVAVRAAAHLGLTMLGENYAQELQAKAQALADDAISMNWHFIGQLQTNKVRVVAEHVHTWQSVDRLKVAREIAKRAPGARAFAQVNLSPATNKAGCSFDELDELVATMGDLDLDVQGLMGVGSAGDDEETKRGFDALRHAVDRLGLQECSMGMTGDLELAVAAGSTMVRVGTDVFGPRP